MQEVTKITLIQHEKKHLLYVQNLNYCICNLEVTDLS